MAGPICLIRSNRKSGGERGAWNGKGDFAGSILARFQQGGTLYLSRFESAVGIKSNLKRAGPVPGAPILPCITNFSGEVFHGPVGAGGLQLVRGGSVLPDGVTQRRSDVRL